MPRPRRIYLTDLREVSITAATDTLVSGDILVVPNDDAIQTVKAHFRLLNRHDLDKTVTFEVLGRD